MNAVLSCLSWMKHNIQNYVRDRPVRVTSQGRKLFFDALGSAVVHSSSRNNDNDLPRLELTQISRNA